MVMSNFGMELCHQDKASTVQAYLNIGLFMQQFRVIKELCFYLILKPVFAVLVLRVHNYQCLD